MDKYLITALILAIAISADFVAAGRVRERRIEVEAISPPTDKSEEKNVSNHVEANPNVNISLDGRHESNVPVAQQPATTDKPEMIEVSTQTRDYFLRLYSLVTNSTSRVISDSPPSDIIGARGERTSPQPTSSDHHKRRFVQ